MLCDEGLVFLKYAPPLLFRRSHVIFDNQNGTIQNGWGGPINGPFWEEIRSVGNNAVVPSKCSGLTCDAKKKDQKNLWKKRMFAKMS